MTTEPSNGAETGGLPRKPARVLMLFFDGVGIGPDDSSTNPFTSATLGFFPQYLARTGEVLQWPYTPQAHPLARTGHHVGVDACLSVPGTPQSATGQASLLTGKNCSMLLGRHLTAFPNDGVAAVVRAENLLLKAERAGFRAAFLNTYTPRFFAEGWPHSVSTLCALSLQRPLFQLDDDLEGRSLFHDFTRRGLRQSYGEAFTVLEPYVAGLRLAGAASRWDVSLYEHFLTDQIGHRRDLGAAFEHVGKLEAFVSGVLEGTDLREALVVIVSDHGNLEDVKERGHTRHPVPVSAWGPGAAYLTQHIADLTDVTPTLLYLLTS